jgi:hypothetical protein
MLHAIELMIAPKSVDESAMNTTSRQGRFNKITVNVGSVAQQKIVSIPQTIGFTPTSTSMNGTQYEHAWTI